jgi:hypothetical protein
MNFGLRFGCGVRPRLLIVVTIAGLGCSYALSFSACHNLWLTDFCPDILLSHVALVRLDFDSR